MNHEIHPKSGNGPKACTTCAKAKSRCNPGPTESICERCHRLNKSCSAQTPAPPRKRKAPKPTRVAELEKRLEDLTARVESRQPRRLTPTDGDSTVDSEGPPQKVRRYSFPDFRAAHQRPGYSHIFAPDSPDNHDQHRKQPSRNERQIYSQSDKDDTQVEYVAARQTAAGSTAVNDDTSSREPTQSQHSQRTAKSSSSSFLGASTASGPGRSQQSKDPSRKQDAQWSQSSCLGNSSLDPGASKIGDPWYYPVSDEAQQLLDFFNMHSVSLFPFVVIPPNMTPEALRRDRPLLWKAVMMQGLQSNARRQVSMGDELLHDIMTAAFLQSRKSFELLQALQILLAWFHMSTKSFQLTNLLFLMRSICVSLGFTESQEFSKQQQHTLANLEHMRAFSGVYYLVTMVFTTNKKPDAFMNTTYLDHCCRILEEKMEYPTDQLVVLLVRTQQLSQSISMTLAFRNNRDSLPLPLIIQSFQHEIRQLRNKIPANFHESAPLVTQIHITEILLYEAGLSEDLSAGLGPTDRLELLWECLNATKSMLDARFKKGIDGWPRSIALASSDYTYAMLVCLKLSLLQLPGWDLRLVRKQLDFDEYLVMQIVDLQSFTSWRKEPHSADHKGGPPEGARGPSEFQDPFVRLHIKLSQLRVCILAELSASLPPDPQRPKDISEPRETATLVNGEVAAPGSSISTAFGDAFSDNPMQGLDDPFWQDLYKSNEWETNFSVLLGWGSDDMTVPTYASWTSHTPSY